MWNLTGLITLLIIVAALIVFGILASVYIITDHQHLVKKSLASVSYVFYLIISLDTCWWTLCFSPGDQSGANLKQTSLIAIFSFAILAVLIFIFSFAFHKFWERKSSYKDNYNRKFIKALRTSNVVSIILMVISIIYTVFEASGHDSLALNVISFLALVIAVILGFVNFFMMLKTLRIRWYLSGLILQSLFIIFVMVGLAETNMM